MIILLTGDSLIASYEGLKEPMLDHYLKQKSPHEIINTGISGDNSDHLLARFQRDVLDFPEAEKVFILIGTNDLARGKQVPLGAFGQNIETMIRQLKFVWQSSDIFFISPPAVDERKQWRRSNQLVQRYTNYLEKIVNTHNCGFIDFYHAVEERGVRQTMKGRRNDGLHFGESGYDLLSDMIIHTLAENDDLSKLNNDSQ